jgi:DNA-binding Lrp family transcriptional regulator
MNLSEKSMRLLVLKIEQKERRIDVVEFSQLARAIGISPQDLFERYLKLIDQP